jgi:cytochrome o ubiquinol oxidase subunit 2
MARKKHLSKFGKIALCAGLGLGALVVVVLFLRHTGVAVFDPQGPIAHKERNLMIFGLLLSSVIVIPVFALTFGIVWKYRAGNKKATYSPNLDRSRIAETIWWLIPSLLILIISVVTWQSSHQLDPYKPLNSSVKPITIQVIALDWKWLFIYPEQGIASVNTVHFPAGTPVDFEITSDAPMNSFWIPQLGGQVYAMSGMTTHLHLMAENVGDYKGASANISGEGFAGMHFVASATSSADFAAWVRSAKQAPHRLESGSYSSLLKPSKNNPPALYILDDQTLYNQVIMKYMGSDMQHDHTEAQ